MTAPQLKARSVSSLCALLNRLSIDHDQIYNPAVSHRQACMLADDCYNFGDHRYRNCAKGRISRCIDGRVLICIDVTC